MNNLNYLSGLRNCLLLQFAKRDPILVRYINKHGRRDCWVTFVVFDCKYYLSAPARGFFVLILNVCDLH